ncbi:MAG: cytochrome c [Gammaproteobacteria bacterium]|nr:cytochrome c [Gammaproteobacteria bacterium]MBU1655725.1 cytochrome c [Gammaproteobacteria bacterium]MBU1960097.1 cytochrome c [Gammaproteobacteria bacterium]
MIRTAALALTLLILAPSLGAAEPEKGKALHDKHCLQCHGGEVMTRPDRRVQDRGQLRNQVSRCEQNLNLRWFEDDIDNVTELLNRDFYHFP